MKYISTRGNITPVGFKDAIMMGLATDGGLLLPGFIPVPTEDDLHDWSTLPYPDLAFKIMSLFIDDMKADVLQDLVRRSYSTFDNPEITPVVSKNNIFILELFHGPTLAFKDVALQFLGNAFEHLLSETGSKMNILGATSGDTGSAAIYGVKGRSNINIFILHPYKRVSPVQELQMTTVMDANVFNIAINGTFDDGQAIVKEIFNDLQFKQQYRLGAVNSINWARVLAQMVYYFYAYFRAKEITRQEQVYFSVPTGNFGDIFAGYLAKRMLKGRIKQLILATNENDILARFINTGDYSISNVVSTISPSMDIQVASNFERYLYYLYSEDPRKVKEAMEAFGKTGRLSISGEEQKLIRAEFIGKRIEQEKVIATIKSFYQDTGYILDPHSAIGVRAGLDSAISGIPLICLATAHPAKFMEAVSGAIGKAPDMPEPLKGLSNRESRCEILDAKTRVIKDYIARNAL